MLKTSFINNTYYIDDTTTNKIVAYIEEHNGKYVAKSIHLFFFDKTFDFYEDAFNYILNKYKKSVA